MDSVAMKHQVAAQEKQGVPWSLVPRHITAYIFTLIMGSASISLK